MKQIDLQIDELVLNGFAAADGYTIADTVERELARLFMEQGIPQAISQPTEVADFRVEVPASQHGSNAETTGGDVAQALYGGLGQ